MNGNLLAYNRLVNTVTIQDMTDSDQTVSERNEELNGILEQVLEIVEKNGDSVIDSFGISLDSEGNYQFNQTSETQRLRFVADVYGCVSADDLTAEQKGRRRRSSSIICVQTKHTDMGWMKRIWNRSIS